MSLKKGRRRYDCFVSLRTGICYILDAHKKWVIQENMRLKIAKTHW